MACTFDVGSRNISFICSRLKFLFTGTENEEPMTLYTYGLKDVCTVFFYVLITIVVHAVLQEYAIDVSAVGLIPDLDPIVSLL